MRPVLAAALFWMLSMAPAANAQVLANGNFEAGPDIPLANPIFAIGVGGTALTGWSVVGGAICIITDNYWVPLSGHRSLELSSASGPGGVQQSFATSAGATYRVTFWLSGEPFSSPTVKTLRVNAGPVQQDFTFDNTPAWHWDMAWAEHTLDFTANASSSTLKFSSLDASPWGAALDSVKVALLSAGVPAAPRTAFAGVSPDPVGAQGAFAFSLASAAHVSLVVRDVQGREVARPVDALLGPGAHRVPFAPQASGLPAGVYFAQFRADDTVVSRRFAVLR